MNPILEVALVALGIVLLSIAMLGLPGGIVYATFRPIVNIFYHTPGINDLGDQGWPLAIAMSIGSPIGIVPAYIFSSSSWAHIIPFPAWVAFSLAVLVWCLLVTVLCSVLLRKGVIS